MLMKPSKPSTESFLTTDSDSQKPPSSSTTPSFGSPGGDRRFTSSVNLDKLLTTTSSNTTNKNNITRLVAVRYFLDRPGYGLHNSAMRLWFEPPPRCTCQQVRTFLREHQIALPGLLVEVFLDQFGSFMMLEACEIANIEWDFEMTDAHSNPGVLNIRLTDLVDALEQGKEYTTKEQTRSHADPTTHLANVTPSGLFAFSMMVGLEATYLMESLVPGTVTEAFLLTWGPYMFFCGGLMQILVAIFQVVRNNVYGATAFFGFGCFWFSLGTAVILKTYTAQPGTLADELTGITDPWGNFIRIMFVFAFSCALLIQTFAMNRLSTILISLLCIKVGFQSVAGWSKAVQWLQFVFGVATALFAFYVFVVELTNQVYHREVFPVMKWSEHHSPEETFGAAGRTDTLHSKATRLRQALIPTPRILREATPTAAGVATVYI